MYLNMAAAKEHDPRAYDLLLDLINIVFTQEEDTIDHGEAISKW